MSEKRPHLNQEIAAFISELDKLTSEREGLEKTFNTDQWDMLVALMSFSTRIIKPSRKLVDEVQGLKSKIMDTPEEFQGYDGYLKRLTEIEGNSRWNFRPREEDDIA